VLTAVWAAARQRLAGPNAILAILVVLVVPLTTDVGEWLERRVPSSELVRTHAELGDTAVFYAIPIAVLALMVWWRGREGRAESGRRTYLAPLSIAVTSVVAVLALVAAVTSVYGMYRIGDSGAKAAWNGNFNQQDAGPGHR
jgi:heme/copper-type cytochrome/quinol oxidase subunit 2